MFCTKSEKTARQLATEHGSYYGHSVFPPKGAIYVGSVDELLKIGVVNPRNPIEYDEGPSNDWKGAP